MDLAKMSHYDACKICMAQDRFQSWALKNMAMYLQIS
jgi:hypothetical protein